MNSTWQVARTYLWRPRFWFLGGLYALLMGLVLYAKDATPAAQVTFSVILSSLIVCFLALHVRRQFGNEAVELMPRHAGPHLAAAALASALFWAIIPCILIVARVWPAGALAAHAVPGILAGVVAFWPRALVLLITLPILLGWATSYPGHGPPIIELLLNGELPAASALLLAGVVVSHIVAGIALVRLPRSGVAANDELGLEASAQSPNPNSFIAWTLSSRDAAAERLAHCRILPSISRWRVPLAISWFQLSLPVLGVLVACVVGAFFGAIQECVITATVVSVALMLVVPYGPWHLRRKSFQQEFLLPVARADFFRQIALALAWDVLVWLAAGTLLGFVVFTTMAFFSTATRLPDALRGLAAYSIVLWSMAVFLYGLALATMRFRLWLLIIAIGGMAWMMGVWCLAVVIVMELQVRPQSFLLPIAGSGFVTLSVGTGVILTLFTYRRWLEADLP